MTSKKNLAASVQARLLQMSKQQGEDFQLVLTRYGLERFLYRLCQSRHAQNFTLKGAVLFQLWTGQTHRATKDLDLLGTGSPSQDRLRQIVEEIVASEVPPDGLSFDLRQMTVEQIKENDDYQGIRVRLVAKLEQIRIPLQIDVGFGDAITPSVRIVTMPALLEFPPPTIASYPQETVIAEKLEAMVSLGIANSRMKDFYDLWILQRLFSFDGIIVAQAIQATFQRRQTALPVGTPLALTDEFSQDKGKQLQWKAFINKGRLLESPPAFHEIILSLRQFLMPPLEAIQANTMFTGKWNLQVWE